MITRETIAHTIRMASARMSSRLDLPLFTPDQVALTLADAVLDVIAAAANEPPTAQERVSAARVDLS